MVISMPKQVNQIEKYVSNNKQIIQANKWGQCVFGVGISHVTLSCLFYKLKVCSVLDSYMDSGEYAVTVFQKSKASPGDIFIFLCHLRMK